MIAYDGQQFLARMEGDDQKRIAQEVTTKIGSDSVSVGFTGMRSGKHRGVVAKHPAIIAHYHALDKAQLAASIAELPPAPEPIREPFVE